MLEARDKSLYQRLHTAGLLDEVMRDLIDGVKPPRDMARYLKTKGIDIGERAVYNLLRTHGTRWRYEQAEASASELGLPGDMDAAAAEMLRRKIALCMFEADGLKELSVLARISGDTEKLKQAERKVRVLEQREERAVLAAQQQGAAELDAILGEAEALRAAQEERQQSLRDKEPETTRLEKLRRRMYGSAAILLDAKEGGQP